MRTVEPAPPLPSRTASIGPPSTPPGDIRHTYAVRTLIDWYQAEENITAKLPVLFTILGHADPASTYGYLQASPELLAVAPDRLERVAGLS
jgi:hypothetical protein